MFQIVNLVKVMMIIIIISMIMMMIFMMNDDAYGVNFDQMMMISFAHYISFLYIPTAHSLPLTPPPPPLPSNFTRLTSMALTVRRS
jgi:hypothetical protein